MDLKRAALFGIVACWIAIFGCSKGRGKPEDKVADDGKNRAEKRAPVPAADREALVESNNRLAMDLYPLLAKDAPGT
ncbi:MAG: hypothetical protein FJ271_01490 [Planctomycetes bacterium]|nr:hypothetical protein [Planctomycetota bacterium]